MGKVSRAGDIPELRSWERGQPPQWPPQGSSPQLSDGFWEVGFPCFPSVSRPEGVLGPSRWQGRAVPLWFSPSHSTSQLIPLRISHRRGVQLCPRDKAMPRAPHIPQGSRSCGSRGSEGAGTAGSPRPRIPGPPSPADTSLFLRNPAAPAAFPVGNGAWQGRQSPWDARAGIYGRWLPARPSHVAAAPDPGPFPQPAPGHEAARSDAGTGVLRGKRRQGRGHSPVGLSPGACRGQQCPGGQKSHRECGVKPPVSGGSCL